MCGLLTRVPLEDSTRWREEVNCMLSWPKTISREILFGHDNIKFISSRHCLISSIYFDREGFQTSDLENSDFRVNRSTVHASFAKYYCFYLAPYRITTTMSHLLVYMFLQSVFSHDAMAAISVSLSRGKTAMLLSRPI